MTLQKSTLCAGLVLGWMLLDLRAQTSVDGPEIRGRVTELGTAPGSLIGVPGVSVTATKIEVEAASNANRTSVTVLTDAQGTYRIRPSISGNYILSVSKPGYLHVAGSDFAALTREEPTAVRDFSVIRLGQVTGRVVDDEGKPAVGVKVAVSVPGYVETIETTDQSGYFAAKEQKPGLYVARIPPGEPRVVEKFTAADYTIVDQDFDGAYWPGGSDLASALPVNLVSGGSADVGTIRAHKIQMFRAHISVKDHECRSDETLMLSVVAAASRGRNGKGSLYQSFLPCAKDLLVRNLRPDAYQFELWNAGQNVEDQWGVASYELRRENFDIKLSMVRGMDLVGRIVAAEGAKLPPMDSIFMNLNSLRYGVGAGPNVPPPDADGKFAIPNVPWPEQLITVRFRPQAGMVGGTHYVQAIRFNGQVVSAGMLTLIPGAVGQLEIVIDDRPATVTGRVIGKLTGRPIVMMTRWPMPPVSATEAAFRQTSIEPLGGSEIPPDGAFRISGLRPGEYRVFTVSEDQRSKISEVGYMERLASQGQKVVVERGVTYTITLEVSGR